MDHNSLKIVGEAYDTIKRLKENWKRRRDRGVLHMAPTNAEMMEKARADATIMAHLPEMILELYEGQPKHKPELEMWKTGDGRNIHVRKLDDNHLVNIIRFLRGTAWTTRKNQLPVMIAEANRRGLST